MRTEQDLISIIMPAYNASAFIGDAITSVLQQTYRDWELIVIDDGSTDDTPSIVEGFQEQDTRIIYHRQDNQRLGAARNTGFRLAKGTWIAFLDADDLWMNDKLEIQLASACDQNATIDVVFTAGYYLYKEVPEPGRYDSLKGHYTGKSLYPILLKHNHIPVLSVMIRRTFLTTVGWQDTAPIVHGNEDWDYWLRACKARGNFLGLEQRSFKYRVHDNGMSAKRAVMLTAACYVVCKNYDTNLLSPDDRLYHQTALLAQIPFISKRLLKTGNTVPGLAGLLFRMIAIALPLALQPKRIYQAFFKKQA